MSAPTPAQVKRWREDAAADGWSHKPTYGDHESEERAATLNKDGWTVMTLARSEKCCSLSAWGPDRLAVTPPLIYDMAALQAGLLVCGYCNQPVEQTQRVGFAGRSCDACLATARARDERPGWTN